MKKVERDTNLWPEIQR